MNYEKKETIILVLLKNVFKSLFPHTQKELVSFIFTKHNSRLCN